MAVKRLCHLSALLIVLLLAQPILAGNLDWDPTQKYVHPEIPRITAHETKILFDQGKVILADAHLGSYNRKHIIGSISLPANEIRKTNITLPRNVIVAFYCA